MPLRKTLYIHSHSVYATSLCIHNPFKQLGQLASKLSVRGQALWMTKNMLFHAKKHGLSWKLVDLKSLYEWVDDEKDGENSTFLV